MCVVVIKAKDNRELLDEYRACTRQAYGILVTAGLVRKVSDRLTPQEFRYLRELACVSEEEAARHLKISRLYLALFEDGYEHRQLQLEQQIALLQLYLKVWEDE